ncbi:MBL fold metallo-hydrolase [Hyalangium versicolor]|uniref:MBL fold metallo-hydrolase n=1 Tax=Hyalangium versicolor TaxID=2861190 RepID=UPI001CCCCB7C|nr:MBL fold metallo-hydrolase [Hyalangium versicolor]
MPQPMYLKQNVALEPLYNQWYAWWYLIPPQTAPMFVAQLHTRIMQSFVAAPDIHVAALKNPALMGGPYINYPADRANEVKLLLEKTQKEQAASYQFVEALAELDKMLLASTGHSLESLYPKVPDILRGYVELTYDLNNRATARFIEPLLYHSPHYRESSQSMLLRTIDKDARSYIFSTPRLDTDGGIHLHLPFRHEGVDALFAMRKQPGSVDAIREKLGIGAADEKTFSTFFTEEPPRAAPRYDGEGVRLRYFGHACLLIESKDVSILTDPVVSYDFPTDLPRFTHADLPERIDYVLITHGHADHLMLETLIPLRGRIGTIIVPRSTGGSLADPSLKLLLRNVGFPRVIEIEDLDSLEIPGGSLTGLPFLGEHGDLNIRAKTAHLIRLQGQSMLMAADSNAIEPRVYDHVQRVVGKIDALFLGMESEGAPMSWMYGPLLHTPLQRKMDQSRRLNGSNGERGIEIVKRLHPKHVYVYAMGREPWLSHVMVMGYTETSPQLIESRKLLDYCREQGLTADMPFIRSELFLGR